MSQVSAHTTTPSREVGRKLVVRVVLIAMTLSVFTIATFMLTQGQTRAPQQLLRLALTVVLCIYLLRSAAWARWTSALLFLVGGLLSLGAGFTLLSTPSSAWVMVCIGAIYLYCAGVLIASRSVSAFFGQARGGGDRVVR
jgi:hypothetical protein